ncbi:MULTISPECIES: Gfo/Idh/MocA family oxidoreductase [Pseudomonas syringae group]|uniref:Oxidoreductase n=2 Tax=Pseudomonas syringae group TaxID=136849 RepID=A0ABY1U8H1_PSESX|nr:MULTISPECIES: Gfo/Idh/MocA family oxidoreductase [Pseudomonas syringae group]KWT01107.1 oxidoreductase [Pseudomonas syringae pv. avii]PHN68624.1 oxidoreductase [Pseudomonas syringae]POQ08304.1 thiazolinyl imide reductase [Pseudomonas syringae pv. avii]RMR18771.1 bactin synthetase, thiazolinyl reductase component [Pseudomonas syringae pv. persicae]SOQ10455.1 yersiniabactin synthetase, thiazolinyl reductase component [Pseudomonas syringae pv. persicae]
MKRPLKVLVVGAKFGELYLNSFLLEQPGLQLAGLLANGSPRARALANAFGIALYTDVEQLPDDLDIACVVVRSAVVGGAGGQLTESLLRRGLHVIQEHPVHPDELVRHQQLATRMGCQYIVNSFYPHTEAGRCWAGTAQRISRLLEGRKPNLAQLTTSRQLLYSGLDLLFQALGCDLARQVSVSLLDGDDDFHTLSLNLPDSRVLLRLQRWMAADDPDLHSLVMHQLNLAWPSGYLSLDATYGPVNWTPALHAEAHDDDRQTLYTSNADYLQRATAMPLHPAASHWRSAHEIEGPAGVGWLLQQLLAVLQGRPRADGLQADYQLAVARLWQDILRCAGPAEQRMASAPLFIDAAQLRAEG